MAELIESGDGPPMFTGLGLWLDRASKLFAMLGGLTFVALIVLSLVSIIGRKIFATPVNGDVELMQMGSAIGAAMFLPVCTLHDHHIRVDAATAKLPGFAIGWLDTIAYALMAFVSAVIVWRTTLSALDVIDSFEVSPLLAIPMWWPVAALVPSFSLLTLTALYRAHLAWGRARSAA